MNVSAHIRNYEVVNKATAHVVASINFQSEASAQDIRTALQKVTESKLTPIEGSVILRDQGRNRHVVSAFMTLSSEVISIPDESSIIEMTGFRALSSNMFMDDSENLWELKSEGGRNLVRTHVQNNVEEMELLMSSISSSNAFASTSSTSDTNIEAAILAERNAVHGGDFLTYVSESGKLESTLVIADVLEDKSLLCLSSDGEEAIQVNRNAVCMYVKADNYVSSLEVPDGMAALSGAVNLDAMVDYYSRVYGYNQEYLAKLTTRIRSHAFA